MFLNIISDLHLDVNNRDVINEKIFDLGPDVINIIAGDIDPNISEKINFLSKKFSGKTIFVNGNHDYYYHDLANENVKIQTNNYIRKNNINNIVFLEKDVHYIDDLKIIGCTLWVDFNLYKTPVYSRYLAEKKINDYKNINYNGKLITTENVLEKNKESVKFLISELNKNWHGKIIVVTHHSPLPESLNIEFYGDNLNPAFASDLRNIIENYSPDLWIHGHIHAYSNYFVNKTQIICNPYGYDFEPIKYKYPFVIKI